MWCARKNKKMKMKQQKRKSVRYPPKWKSTFVALQCSGYWTVANTHTRQIPHHIETVKWKFASFFLFMPLHIKKKMFINCGALYLYTIQYAIVAIVTPINCYIIRCKIGNKKRKVMFHLYLVHIDIAWILHFCSFVRLVNK